MCGRTVTSMWENRNGSGKFYRTVKEVVGFDGCRFVGDGGRSWWDRERVRVGGGVVEVVVVVGGGEKKKK
ncbi:hypothetical protein Hanom_Chr09g00795961 [Helianthus anomalus]